MAADWDEDSERLWENLRVVLRAARDDALARRPISLSRMREWHATMMEGLEVRDFGWIGVFRGEEGAERVEVEVGAYHGTFSSQVAEELKDFDLTLQAILTKLDEQIPKDSDLNDDQLTAVLEVMGWVHAEWVRIHPFANGNGRTARVLANALAMRYGLPPFVRLRPRPDGGYRAAAEAAMLGEWQPTARAFRRQLTLFLRESEHGRNV